MRLWFCLVPLCLAFQVEAIQSNPMTMQSPDSTVHECDSEHLGTGEYGSGGCAEDEARMAWQ